jgi:hypothetical protein
MTFSEMIRALRRRCWFHDWQFVPIRNQLWPVFRCAKCKMWSFQVRWFPDRFRWFY